MQPATDFARLPGDGATGSEVSTWKAYDPASKVDLHGTAVRAGGHLFLIDPIPLEEEALSRLIAGDPVTAILLTNANHARAASEFRSRYSIPILAHAAARAGLGIGIDAFLPEEGRVFDTFDAVPLPGGPAGEVALYLAEGGGLMIVGDAVIDLPPHGFSLLPDKYAADPAQLRRSLAKLLDFPFARMTLAHGNPVAADARTRLAGLLHAAE